MIWNAKNTFGNSIFEIKAKAEVSSVSGHIETIIKDVTVTKFDGISTFETVSIS